MSSYPPSFKTPRKPRASHEQALYEWRRSDPSDPKLKNKAKSIGEVMPGLLSGMKLEKRLSDLEILRVWNNSIDPAITAHAQPVNIVRGTLFVTVDSPVWRDEIVRYRRKEILARLQHSFGSEMIAKISFRVG